MEIRLAHEQGLIHQRDLNHFQNFALRYWIYLDRRTANDDRDALVELQCFRMFPERWAESYLPVTSSQDEEEIPVTDIDELDRWYNSRGTPRAMSGSTLHDFRAETEWPTDEHAWTDWS